MVFESVVGSSGDARMRWADVEEDDFDDVCAARSSSV